MNPVRFLVGIVACVGIAGCGGSTTSAGPAKADRPPTILTDPVQPTTFVQAQTAMLALYSSRRALSAFTVENVEYTPATRDKVLSVCRAAGPEKSASARESARVLACAPLIFFFYSYGRQASVPEAIAVARRLYWYAVTNNREPYQAGPGLTRLLRSWGVT